MNTDPAHVLFPNDTVPSSSQAPDWFSVRHAAAEQRLSGQHRQSEADGQAARMFPSETQGAGSEASRPADHDPDTDIAEKLFMDDASQFDGKPVEDFMSGFAQSAVADGDIDRAQELEAAGKALVADFRAAGASSDDVREAFDIIRERQGDTVTGPVSEEKLEADKSAAIAELTAEGITEADLNAARALVRDLDVVAPGTIRTLEATGAGNDPRLVRKIIAEARRRNYR